MCLICLEYNKNNMTIKEAQDAAWEIILTEDHLPQGAHILELLDVHSKEEFDALAEKFQDLEMNE